MSSPTPYTPSPAPDQPPSPSPAQDQGFLIRMGVLVALLLCAIGALAYDHFAWNQAKEAYELVMSLPKDDKLKKVLITQADIHDALKRKPSIEGRTEGVRDPGSVEDVFEWQRGLPFRTFEVVVVYHKGNNDRLIFSTVYSSGIESSAEELPPPPPTVDMPPAALPPGPPPSRGGTDMPPMRPPMEPSTNPLPEKPATPEPAPKSDP